jgi:hypothetical protein
MPPVDPSLPNSSKGGKISFFSLNNSGRRVTTCTLSYQLISKKGACYENQLWYSILEGSQITTSFQGTVPDSIQVLSYDSNCFDADEDLQPDSIDSDDDGDGIPDAQDPDNLDTDDDGDGEDDPVDTDGFKFSFVMERSFPGGLKPIKKRFLA